jgi:general secretion pathway protein J
MPTSKVPLYEGRAGGFTLLELTVAITILGLILVALGNGVHFAGRAWQTQERLSARQGDLDAVQNFLRNLVASGTHFEGDGTALRFVNELPEALGHGGLYDIEIRTVGDRLTLSWHPHFKGPDANSTSKETELVRSVAGLRFSYLVDPASWETRIADKIKPPALIRLELDMRDGRTWPPLVMAPAVEVVPSVTN